MKKRSIVLLFIYLFSTTNMFLSIPLNADTTIEYVIMYDEYHGQFFDRELMSKALDSLNELIIYNNETKERVEIKIDLIFNNETAFNSTNLQGVDLLIMTNFGFEEENNLLLSERLAILDFMELGGSLFALCNPLSYDVNITGNPVPLNVFLNERDSALTTARIRTPNTVNSTVLVDDFSHVYENNTFISLKNYESDHTIFEQEVTISNLTLYSSSIELGNELRDVAIGRTLNTTYSVSEPYEIFRDPATGFLTWFLSQSVGNSRFVLSGSTIMFSDLDIIDGEKWIDQDQNLDLWKNTILWLLRYTPHPELPALPLLPFWSYALIVVGIAVIIFGMSVLLYRYRINKKTEFKVK
ncbi:MAG: hypothetical protein KGD64_00110 [Candidatus Heimdallarchaeota archaeon]|nr:hypothetical protein [Candidatus Heimdallarchaeota archaeon]